MPAAINQSVAAVASAVATLESSAVVSGGSDTYIFGASVTQGEDTTGFKFGGASGTSLGAPVHGPADFSFGFGNLTTYGRAPGPAGSNTIWASFNASTFAAIAAVMLEGVDSVGPEATTADDVFVNGPAAASIVIPDTVPGQLVLAVFAVVDIGGAGIASIVEGADTDMVVQALAAGGATGDQRTSIAVVSGVAAGTSITLNVDITMSTAGTFIGWRAAGRYFVDAAGGGGFLAAWAKNNNRLLKD